LRSSKKIKELVILFGCLFFVKVQAQELLDSISLAVYQEYTDLDEALKNPDNVVKLSLRKKKYRSFPTEVLKFKNLQYLDLSKNSIKELSDSIVTLKNLQFLIVSKSGLERLPVNIGRMKNLKYLNINQNNVSTLPFSFGSLDNLEFLDMWSNNLDYMPENFDKLKKLRWLDLRNILITKTVQDAFQNALPNAKMYFSPPCNCGG
jgi:Leucine-rich repeat (LRR) protein